jgi:hypothetical protein
MKSTICLLAVAAVFTLISCNNNKKDSQVVTTADTTISVKDMAAKSMIEGTKKTISTQEVPDTIEYAFKEKYPAAVSPVWVEYTPVDTDELAMDNSYYYVTFQDKGTELTSWYNNFGDWVKTSTKIPGDTRLPDAVNKTLNEQYPGYKIEEINKENDKNIDMYEIKLNKGEEKAKLKVLLNGEVFNRKEK